MTTTNRITKKNLVSLIETLNQETGSPVTYFTTNLDDTRTIAIGHFHLDIAYGGYSLVRTVSTGGAVTDRHIYGRYTAKILYSLIHAFLEGYRFNKEQAQQEAA